MRLPNFNLNVVFQQKDPRIYQIIVLSGLLVYGVVWLGFDVSPIEIAVIIGIAEVAQLLCTRLFRLPRFDPKSCLISGLSLCLLLRTDSLFLGAIAAVVAVVSKFVFRWNRKHIFNPTNFSLVLMMGLYDRHAWVSPGQWGHVAFLGFLFAILGMLVVVKAARSDVTLAFCGFYCALLIGRALWLGDPWSIFLHKLQSGAFLLFSFFMISDPKTTPDSVSGRILFAGLVALGAYFVQFNLYRPHGLLWSLVVCCMSVPLIDRLLPGQRYEWNQPNQPLKGVINETKIIYNPGAIVSSSLQ